MTASSANDLTADDRRRELLELLLESESPAERREQPNLRARHDTPVASFAQQRLWYMEKLNGPSPTYNVPMALRAEGTLDIARLERCVNEIIRRHDVLRTRFTESGGMPVQVIADWVEVSIKVESLRHLASDERDEDVRRRVRQEAARPFDLSSAPLLRVTVLELSEREHILLAVLHHIVSDGWSIGVLVGELSALYASDLADTPARLPALPIQYVHFVNWQREWLDSSECSEQLAYWSQQLAGLPPLVSLPTDRVRPAVLSQQGATVSFTLPWEVQQRAAALSRAENVTPFMLLLTAFKVLIWRYTGQADIVVGTPVANRTRLDVEALVGLFVNTLALRSSVQGRMSFRDLLQQVRETTLRAYGNQELPFEKVVEALRPERSLSHSPLFQLNFTLQNLPFESLQLPDLRVSPLPIDSGTSKFDLTMHLEESVDGLHGLLEYSTDLFEEATIHRLAGHYSHLIESILSAPDARIDGLAMLAPTELRQLLVDWNACDASAPGNRCVHEMFAQQAARTPDAIALVYEGMSTTYAELDRKSNQLAHYLRARGVAPETVVGICMERSPAMVIGMLGVLKAGGAYLPMDPDYPAERLAYIESDAHMPLVLSESSLDWSAIEQEPATPLDPGARPGNIAYVIYTSGSTGVPKGAANTHRGFANLIAWYFSGPLAITQPETVILGSSPSFDLTQKNILGTLVVGATLVIPEGPVLDVRSFRAAMDGAKPTRLNCAPSAFRLLMDKGRCGSLRAVVLGGEPIDTEISASLAEQGVLLLNSYGPTECSDVVASYAAPAEPTGRVLPIGKPIGNARLYILDTQLNPVPIGVTGELYVGGACVGRGYLHRPALTAERFVADPFGEAGARLYATGDLARHLPDGNIEFLGRSDFQVKVRGFRIELEEIEAQLLTHPQVHAAVVVAREELAGEKRLVAYVAGEGDAPLDGQTLREYLSARLPDYMIPSGWMTLPEMPLTPSGKIDRRNLPDLPLQTDDGEYVSPRTPIERALADIWADVLSIERIGVRDGFFDLGGHSLMATRVLSRIREVFQVELGPRVLFDAPTVEQLARQVEARRKEGLLSVPPLVKRPRPASIPLSFAQERLWFLEQLGLVGTAYNIPLAQRITGELDAGALERSFRDLIRRHENLRTHFVARNGAPVQVMHEPGDYRLEQRDLSTLPADDRQRTLNEQMQEERRHKFDLARGPLLRVVLVKLGETEHMMLTTVHHIVLDHWSINVLMKELSALYAAHAHGERIALPPLELQYADYSIWQKQWLQGDALESRLTYWREQLRDAPPMLELPVDRPRPPIASYRGGVVKFELTPDLAFALVQLAEDEGVTLYMVLLAAFQLLLSRYSGQNDIVVGSPVAGRTHPGIEGLIGFFVNTLVMRTRIDGRRSMRELLAQVKEMTLGAYAHEELPFEKLVAELHPQRDLSRQPIFQVIFDLQNTPFKSVDKRGLVWEPAEARHGTAQFDLTLHMHGGREGLNGFFEYAADLFDEPTLERLVGHFKVLLGSIVDRPDDPVRDLPMLSPAERQQALVTWNDTQVSYPDLRCVHELFDEQARRTPEASALIFEDTELSYRELRHRSDRLASDLQRLGVRPEVVVGLCMERSVEMVVAVLAVLKAGGAYLPLEPTYPLERLEFMRSNAHVGLVLTQARFEDRCAGAASCIRVDEQWPEIASEPLRDTGSGVGPNHLAYLIYTSGSTGRPKAVMCHHGGLTNKLQWRQSALGLSASDRVLHKTPFSFDVSIWELLWPLLSGATLVVARPGGHMDPLYLRAIIRQQRITTIHFVPSMLRTAVEHEVFEGCESLQRVFASGEALPGALAAALRAQTKAVIYNLYGPTEAAIEVSCHRVDEDPAGTVPIGRPIANVQLYVLDPAVEPVPVGVPGELYIAGVGVARGYRAGAALTAERFVANPFAEGQRMYRTGDRARLRPDGEIEFLGRADAQVKVRGYRIEPGEIEAMLLEHPAIREAVVLTHEDSPGDARLIGYLVPSEGSIDLPGLREWLLRRLPEYMIPAAWVMLDALPIGSSGKLDRRSLPIAARAVAHEPYVEASTDLQRDLASLWKQVLKIDRLGIRDNFFALGGDSLLLVSLHSALEERYAKGLALVDLFTYPTIETLSSVLDARVQAPSLQVEEGVL